MYILHLSDLHFGTPENAELWSSQISDDLSRELNCQSLNAIIFSGDIANYSTQQEYEAAQLFLNSFCKKFSLAPEQIVIVPGNHDLNWELSQEAYSIIRRSQHSGKIDEESVIDKGEFLEVKDLEKYKQRFVYFSSFYQAIVGQSYPLEPEQQYKLHYFPEQNLLVLGLNSAWQLDHHYKSRAGINNKALNNALNQINQDSDYTDFLKIAVWHHPLNGPDEDRIKDHDFMERLAVNGFQLILHGHIHKAQTDLYRYDQTVGGRKLEIICAGTFGAPTKELVPGYPWQYNLLKLESNRLKVETRKRNTRDGAWQPDAQWLQGEGKDPLPRYEIELNIPPEDMQDIPRENIKVLKRGEIFRNIIDGSFYLEPRQLDFKQEIQNQIYNRSPIPTKFIYGTQRGCNLWLDLCQDLDYRYYVDSVNFLKANINDILNIVDERIIQSSPDYISIGPGNGHKDRIILEAILEHHNSSNIDMFYYPLDINPSMIVQAIQKVMVLPSLREKLKIKAIVADFQNLKSFVPVYEYRPEPNIFAMLGNTIGNLQNDMEYLGRIREAMFDEDILIVEMRLKNGNRLRIGGSENINKKFDFTPLDELGVFYTPEKLQYIRRRNRSQVKNTITTIAVYSDFELGDEHIESVELSYVHEYDEDSLTEAIQQEGFSILQIFSNNFTIIYILRKIMSSSN